MGAKQMMGRLVEAVLFIVRRGSEHRPAFAPASRPERARDRRRRWLQVAEAKQAPQTLRLANSTRFSTCEALVAK